MKNDKKPSAELIMAGYLMTAIEEICEKDELKPCDIISFAGCEFLLEEISKNDLKFYKSIIGEFTPFIKLIRLKMKADCKSVSKMN